MKPLPSPVEENEDSVELTAVDVDELRCEGATDFVLLVDWLDEGAS